MVWVIQRDSDKTMVVRGEVRENRGISIKAVLSIRIGLVLYIQLGLACDCSDIYYIPRRLYYGENH
jgi:hypothetical protein